MEGEEVPISYTNKIEIKQKKVGHTLPDLISI